MLRLATAPARFLLDELGQGAWKAVGTFRPLVARYGLKNVPTPIEIIAELLACHAAPSDGQQLRENVRCGRYPRHSALNDCQSPISTGGATGGEMERRSGCERPESWVTMENGDRSPSWGRTG